MESWGMIISGYGVVFCAVFLYALVVVRRGRRLAAELGLGTPDNEGMQWQATSTSLHGTDPQPHK